MGVRKYRPTQCPSCIHFRKAQVDQDPGLKSIAPWTKDRCVKGCEYWWDFGKEKVLVDETTTKCRDYTEGATQ